LQLAEEAAAEVSLTYLKHPRLHKHQGLCYRRQKEQAM
jgi:hypothetical protein